MDTQTRGRKPHEYRKVMEDTEEVSACTHIASTGRTLGPWGRRTGWERGRGLGSRNLGCSGGPTLRAQSGRKWAISEGPAGSYSHPQEDLECWLCHRC